MRVNLLSLFSGRPSRRFKSSSRSSGVAAELQLLEDRSLMTGWMELDTSASDGGISNSSASRPSLAIGLNDAPTVAWSDTVYAGNHVIYLRRWNPQTFMWDQLGDSANGTGISGNDRIYASSPFVALDPSTQNPVVAWQAMSSGGYSSIYLKAWNGTSWQALGNSQSEMGLSQVNYNSATNVKLAFGPATSPGLYVSYEIAGAQIVVRKWNAGSQTWDQVGSTIIGMYSGANEHQLAISPDGQPIVAYNTSVDWIGSIDTFVVRWNGSSWTPFGSSSNISQTAEQSRSPALALDNNGLPVVGWVDGNGTNQHLYLKRFDGQNWVQAGQSATGNGLGEVARVSGTVISIAVDRATNQPVVNYVRPAANPDNNLVLTDSIVIRWDGSVWTDFQGSSGSWGITPELTTVGSSEMRLNSLGLPAVAYNPTRMGGPADRTNKWIQVKQFATGTLRNYGSQDFNDSNYSTPANPAIAVSPTLIAEVTNSSLIIMDKATRFTQLQTYMMDLFAPLPEIDASTNPRFHGANVNYDAGTGRFLIAAVANLNQPRLFLAVSRTANPVDGFLVNSVPLSSLVNLSGAMVRMGANADAWFVTINNQPVIHLISKASAALGQWQTRQIVRDAADRNLVPAIMEGANSSGTMWFITEAAQGTSRTARLIRMTGTNTASPALSSFDLLVSDYSAPANAPQVGGLAVATGGSDFVTAAWRNNRLVAAHTVGLTTTSTSHVRWYDFDTSGTSPLLRQQGTLNPGSGVFTFSPGIGINVDGAIGLTYMQMSATEFPSVYVTGRTQTDAVGTMQPSARLVAGTTSAFSTFDEDLRAGATALSYRGSIAVDSDGRQFWSANAYARNTRVTAITNARWATWLQGFNVTSAPSVVANLVVKDVYVTDAAGNRLTNLTAGRTGYVQFEFEAVNIPAGSRYLIGASVNGLIRTATVTWGAGQNGVQNLVARLGTWKFAQGTSTVAGYVDLLSKIAESSESDNKKSISVTVAAAPNVKITNMYLADAYGNRIVRPSAGLSVYVQVEFQTINIPAGASYQIDLTLNGVTRSYRVNWGQGLAGVGYWTFRLGSWQMLPTLNTISAKLDSMNDLFESNESDNLRSFLVDLRPAV